MTSFVSKPIVSTQTIGEQLRKTREGAHLSLDELSRVLRIKPAYLEAIEQGRYADLPGEIYGLEFIKRYARALRMDPAKAARAYARERGSSPVSSTAAWHAFSVRKPQRFRAVWLGRGMVTLALGAALFWGASLGQHLLGPPDLVIITPAAYHETANSRIVIQGSASGAREVRLNGEPLAIHPDGSFTESLTLAPGHHLLRIIAVGRAGKETTVFRVVVVREGSGESIVIHNN